MGITYVAGAVSRVDGRGKRRRVQFLVDTGAIYTVLPERIWRTLGLRPDRDVEFGLADGSVITRSVGHARFDLCDRMAPSPVVLGQRNEGPLLGAVTLESLGLMVNPMTRQVVPMRLILAGFAPSAATQNPSIFAR